MPLGKNISIWRLTADRASVIINVTISSATMAPLAKNQDKNDMKKVFQEIRNSAFVKCFWNP